MRSRTMTLVFLGLCATTAFAQRTFVSVTGVDNATCSRSAPCRSFGAAVTAVAAGGEVVALDSGGYGGLTITKSISIIAPSGVYAGVTVASGTGITISVPAGIVTLRGLSINGVGGTTGIQVDSIGQLHVENTLISGLVSDGMLVNAATLFLVRDCVIRANAQGINIPNAASGITGMVERTRLDENTAAGATIRDNAAVDFSDTTFFNNTDGIVLIPASVGAIAFVNHCFFDRGSRGIVLQTTLDTTSATTVVGDSTFYHVNDPVHRGGIGSNTAFTFANNQFSGYSYTPTFDTILTLK